YVGRGGESQDGDGGADGNPEPEEEGREGQRQDGPGDPAKCRRFGVAGRGNVPPPRKPAPQRIQAGENQQRFDEPKRAGSERVPVDLPEGWRRVGADERSDGAISGPSGQRTNEQDEDQQGDPQAEQPVLEEVPGALPVI